MRDKLIDSYGPLLKYPPVEEFVRKQDRKETFFKVMSVALGVIGVGGGVGVGIFCIIRGVQTGRAFFFIIGSPIIPASLVGFIIASVVGYRAANEYNRDLRPTLDEIEKAFRHRQDRENGKIDTDWKEFLTRNSLKPKDLEALIKSDIGQAPRLSDDWKVILHRRSHHTNLFLFERGFCGKIWAPFDQQQFSDMTVDCLNLFFQFADKESYLNVFQYPGSRRHELAQALAMSPPRAEVELSKVSHIFNSDYVQKIIEFIPTDSSQKAQWQAVKDQLVAKEAKEAEELDESSEDGE